MIKLVKPIVEFFTDPEHIRGFVYGAMLSGWIILAIVTDFNLFDFL